MVTEDISLKEAISLLIDRLEIGGGVEIEYERHGENHYSIRLYPLQAKPAQSRQAPESPKPKAKAKKTAKKQPKKAPETASKPKSEPQPTPTTPEPVSPPQAVPEDPICEAERGPEWKRRYREILDQRQPTECPESPDYLMDAADSAYYESLMQQHEEAQAATSGGYPSFVEVM